MSELDITRQKIAASRATLERDFNVKKIGVFGSVAKGVANKNSDVDVIVEFKEPIDLFRFSGLKLFLEGVLKKNVDLATPRALKSLIRDEILQTVIYL